MHIEVGTDVKSLGTRPKEIKDVAIETEVKATTDTVAKDGAAPAAGGKEGAAPAATAEAAAGKDAGKKQDAKGGKSDKKK